MIIGHHKFLLPCSSVAKRKELQPAPVIGLDSPYLSSHIHKKTDIKAEDMSLMPDMYIMRTLTK